MGTVVLDSSIVIAVFDSDDPHHENSVAALAQTHNDGHDFAVPASVLAEVLVGEARRTPSAVAARREAVREMFGPTRPIDDDVAVSAARLRADHRPLRLPDALVLATGIVEEATMILTADKRWAAVDDRVRVLEPG